jgi:hypothetical protein
MPGTLTLLHFHKSSITATGPTYSKIQLERGALSGGEKGLKLKTRLQLMPMPRKRVLYIHSTIRLHGVVLN